jgi:steroid 5-alpha reductase family enzyme
MEFLAIFGTGFLVILLFMTAIWLLSLLVKDSSIVDIFWGSGFIVVGLAYYLLTDGWQSRKVLLMLLVAIWGLRLTIHIFARNLGKGEDFRYQKWREQHGASYWWVSFLRVFLLQGVIMWIISAPLVAAQFSATPDTITLFDLLGVILWAVGFFFEAVGDWQLTRFKADPTNKGQVMRTGLWKYTRHPNYFGDAVQWWGFFLFALSVPGGIITIFSPVIMTGLLLRVSGVVLLEKTLIKTRSGYEDYVKTTSAFLPRPPRRSG